MEQHTQKCVAPNLLTAGGREQMETSGKIQALAKTLWTSLTAMEDFLRISAILVMTLLVFISIFLRIVFTWASPAWDEIARYIMIWSIMAGAIVTSREDEHIKMGFVSAILREQKKLKIHDFIVTIITFIFFVCFAVWSYNYMVFSMQRNLRSIVTNIPMFPVHASFFVGAALSVLHYIIHVIRKGYSLFGSGSVEGS
jgi:TRAP-type C4-dicarboxylate transport system permease small subunit